MKQRAIIIGAGLGGLATAALLAKDGYEVTLLEKHDQIGGRARVFEQGGFRFDMGPSWYLMPDVFEHFFGLFGKKVSDYLTLKQLDPSYRIKFADGEEVDFRADIEDTAAIFERWEPGAGEKFRAYISQTEEQYRVALDGFVYKNYDSLLDFVTLKNLRDGRKLDVFRTMEASLKTWFKDERIRKVLAYQLVFLGSSPYSTPALYRLMNHVDFGMGVFYPMGGLHELPQAIWKLCEEHGVHLRLQTEVSRILVEKKKAVGVELADGTVLSADLVISNADGHWTDTKLLGGENQVYSEAWWDRRTLAPSACILYLGVSGRIPQLTHHNLIFSADWKKNFAQIFDQPELPEAPSLYICAPSVTDPSVAPKDHENLFVLVPIPPKVRPTEAQFDAYEEAILAFIAEQFGIDNLAERIVTRRRYTGEDFESDYHSQGGTALGLAHNLGQTAIWRPNNVHPRVKGLYYVGAGTNPGIGMPMVLVSAQLVRKRLKNDTSSTPPKE